MYTILDCYTDEASGLGVPPYLGVYSRYIAGFLKGKVNYLTIDDLRLSKKYSGIVKEITLKDKTQISTLNLTKNNVDDVLSKTKVLIVIVGMHVPGKYLSAVPGTLKEITPLLKDIKCRKILTGPVVYGSQGQGGRFSERIEENIFDEISSSFITFGYDEIKDYSVKGAKKVFDQIKDLRIIEIETGRGCQHGKCSFCTENLKHCLEFRKKEDILKEIETFYKLGARHFRLGKQSCFYSYPEAIDLLKDLSKLKLKTLHIDNVNPVNVVNDKDNKITKAIVKYCTSGNIAAFGTETFDDKVAKENTLNSNSKISFEAIKIINKFGKEKGSNGMSKFLPGLNLVFGLIKESKKTHKENLNFLKKVLDSGLLLRRINIRQVSILPGTRIFKEVGNKFLRKNKKHYFRWRRDIREEIDTEMLKKLVSSGDVLKDCYAEIYDGNKTFLRQIGTYPLIIGVDGRLPLKKFYDVKVLKHMERGLQGEVA